MKKIANFGLRRFLSILGSMSALAGATCAAYGPAPAYGMPTCTQDTDCQGMGTDWYCDKSSGSGFCAHADKDAGTTDKDSGQ